MPLITDHTDSLPYIDRPLTPSSLAAANKLIATELSSRQAQQPIHPLLPPAPSPTFSPLIEAELVRVASKTPLTAIDLTRYEGAPDPSENKSQPPTSINDLKQAYANATYLTQRLQALELLEKFGKNAWLVGNSQLEDVLGGVERELVGVREETEETNRQRREMQERGRGVLEGGEREWRTTIGGVLEAGLAVRKVEEGVREVLREGGKDR